MGLFNFLKKEKQSQYNEKSHLEVEPEPINEEVLDVQINKDQVTIHSLVIGLNYEGRQEKLKNLIDNFIENEVYGFNDLFNGITNKEYKEYNFDEEKLYELQSTVLPYIKIVPEPENEFDSYAQAVYVSEYGEKNWFMIGYLPKKDINRTKDLFNNGRLLEVEGEIKGGAYKYIKLDKNEEDRVYKAKEDYSILLTLIFKK